MPPLKKGIPYEYERAEDAMCPYCDKKCEITVNPNPLLKAGSFPIAPTFVVVKEG